MYIKKEMYIVYNICKYKCSYICCMFYVELIELIKVDYKILVVCMVLVIYIVDLWKYIYGSRLKVE